MCCSSAPCLPARRPSWSWHERRPPPPSAPWRSVAQQVVQTSAVALFAKPSADYADKLAQAQDCLRQAAALGAVTQANSLGVEDMVITHIAQQLQLNLPGLRARYGPPAHRNLGLAGALASARGGGRYRVPPPGRGGARLHPPAWPRIGAVRQHRPAQAMLLYAQDEDGWPAPWRGKKAGLPACAASNRVPARRCPWSIPASHAPSSTPWPTGRKAMSGTTWPSTAWTPIPCTTSLYRASAAPPAPAR